MLINVVLKINNHGASVPEQGITSDLELSGKKQIMPGPYTPNICFDLSHNFGIDATNVGCGIPQSAELQNM